MVNNNKILTVSYGTFSCTLEGFDDPFGAMKSIAEYFRGLAEQDRSFGAEPIAPDTSVLHKIAERESLKQVDAQVEDQGITLRQSDQDLRADNSDDDAGAEHDLSENDALSKLLRLRAAAEDDEQISDEFLEDEHASGSAKSDLTDLDDLEEFEDVMSNHAIAPDAEAHEEPASETAERAAKRQRVKDQIAMNDEGAPTKVEPLAASGDLEDHVSPSADAALPVSPTEVDDTAEEPAQVSRVLRVKRTRRNDGLEDVVVSRTNTPGSDSIEDAAEIDFEAPQQAAQEEVPSLSAEEEADLAAELAQVEAESRAERDAQVDREQATKRGFAAIAPLPPLPLDDSLRVAVQEVSTKVAGEIANKNSENAPQSELHHEIEALLSTMEAESRMDARRERRAQVFDEQEAARDDTALDRILAETNTQMDDQSASRRRNSISHLKAAVQATRADKSSVSDEFAEEEEQETPYRSDLAQAVKPPSPEATANKTPEPKRTSPLVLISEQRIKETEAEQDPSATASRERFVRPRRVNVSTSRKRPDATDADPDAEPVNSTNPDLTAFVAFASDIAPEDTDGFVRAAAAFVTQSSGLSHFSRPQVVKLVTLLNVPGGIARDDALRAFGRLLREGEIIKVSQGCYALTSADASVARGGLQTA